MEKLVFFDVEAVRDSNPKALLQIAAVAIGESLEELESFEVKILFDDQDGTLTHPTNKHYCRHVWSEQAVSARDAAFSFAAFLRRNASFDMISSEGKCYQLAELVAHNAERFDGEIIHEWFRNLGIYCPARFMTHCTKQRAMWFVTEDYSIPRPANNRLKTLCNSFGIEWNENAAHDALADVRATVELYRTLMRLLELRYAASPSVLVASTSRVVRFSPWPSKTDGF